MCRSRTQDWGQKRKIRRGCFKILGNLKVLRASIMRELGQVCPYARVLSSKMEVKSLLAQKDCSKALHLTSSSKSKHLKATIKELQSKHKTAMNSLLTNLSAKSSTQSCSQRRYLTMISAVRTSKTLLLYRVKTPTRTTHR